MISSYTYVNNYLIRIILACSLAFVLLVRYLLWRVTENIALSGITSMKLNPAKSRNAAIVSAYCQFHPAR